MGARTDFPKPPFKPQRQPVPGSSSAMEPEPDYGESTYKGSRRLQDKKAVITGGDSGIGRAVALAFAREGADVLIGYLSEEADAKETQRLVQEAGRTCVTFRGDISKPHVCRNLVRKAVDTFGRIDVLVNNAAHQMSFSSIEEQVPMKRPAQPKEVAPVYVMLASDEASYISGATVAVTGGKPII